MCVCRYNVIGVNYEKSYSNLKKLVFIQFDIISRTMFRKL